MPVTGTQRAKAPKPHPARVFFATQREGDDFKGCFGEILKCFEQTDESHADYVILDVNKPPDPWPNYVSEFVPFALFFFDREAEPGSQDTSRVREQGEGAFYAYVPHRTAADIAAHIRQTYPLRRPPPASLKTVPSYDTGPLPELVARSVIGYLRNEWGNAA